MTGSAPGSPAAILLIRHGCWIGLFSLIGVLYAHLFYPGTMDWDSASIAGMAATSSYATWFPPAFTFLWKITDRIGVNPGAIWLLQTGLMLTGLYLVTVAALKRGRPALAAAVPISAIAPPFAYLFHEISKDTFMAAALLCLSGLATYLLTVPPKNRAIRNTAFAVAIALASLVLSTRYNAIFALTPIFWLVVHAITRSGVVRSAAIAAVSLILIVAGLSVFSRHVLKPLWRPTMSALIAFDIAGITKFSGTPGSRLAERKEYRDQIDRCYSAVAWDSLMWKDCATGYNGHVYHTYIADSRYVLGEWAAAITNHPVAYARHRIAHFMSLLRLTCDACGEMGILLRAAVHNPPGSEVRSSLWAERYEKVARGFFWHIRPSLVFVCAVAMAAWAAHGVFVRKASSDPAPGWMALAFSASAVLYVAAYLVLGVASQFRYVYWSYQALWLVMITAPAVSVLPVRSWPRNGLRRGVAPQ